MPIPAGPQTSAHTTRPARASSQRRRSQLNSRSRPASSGEPPSSWTGSSTIGGGGVEARVLGQHRRLEALQLRPGLDPDLLDQRLARPAVGVQRVGLAPGAVEGEHSLGVEALAQRLLRDQLLEAGDHLVVAPGGELGVDRELDRAQVKLLEPADLGGCERLRGDVGERRPAPELERGTGRAVRLCGAGRRSRAPPRPGARTGSRRRRPPGAEARSRGRG